MLTQASRPIEGFLLSADVIVVQYTISSFRSLGISVRHSEV